MEGEIILIYPQVCEWPLWILGINHPLSFIMDRFARFSRVDNSGYPLFLFILYSIGSQHTKSSRHPPATYRDRSKKNIRQPLYDQEEDSKKMKNRTGQDEEMPDGMVKWEGAPNVKDGPYGIENPTHEEKKELYGS